MLYEVITTVVDVKKEEINRAKSKIPLTAIRHDAEHTPAPASFADAMAASTREAVGIIAEIKKAWKYINVITSYSIHYTKL